MKISKTLQDFLIIVNTFDSLLNYHHIINDLFLIGSNSGLPPIMNFDYSSFQTLETDTVVANHNRTTTVNGKLKVLNTINDFNVLDKNKLLNEIGKNVK